MKNIFGILLALSTFAACTATRKMTGSAQGFDFEAHRGGRGLMPENTIAAMRNAISIKEVRTLEMDVHITRDGLVVVSHDPYFNPLITTTPDGKYLEPREAQKRLLYQMTYADIATYDVGMKPYPDFPRQQKIPAVKPLLTALIDAVELESTKQGRKLNYNIEIKSKPGTDNINHPSPAVFAEKLMAVLKEKNIVDRCIIQSFDPRPLQYLHKQYPDLQLSFLVEKAAASNVADQLDLLGFAPNFYSPAFAAVNAEVVNACHARKVKIVPWTVNTVGAMQQLVDMGVDGIISDYPDLFSQVKLK